MCDRTDGNFSRRTKTEPRGCAGQAHPGAAAAQGHARTSKLLRARLGYINYLFCRKLTAALLYLYTNSGAIRVSKVDCGVALRGSKWKNKWMSGPPLRASEMQIALIDPDPDQKRRTVEFKLSTTEATGISLDGTLLVPAIQSLETICVLLPIQA